MAGRADAAQMKCRRVRNASKYPLILSPDRLQSPLRVIEIAGASTITIVGGTQSSGAPPRKRDELYETAIREFGRALSTALAAGYEADPEKRHDLRQDIHFQLWKSFEVFDGRCSMKTWTFRVAHNISVSYVNRERRKNTGFRESGRDRADRDGRSSRAGYRSRASAPAALGIRPAAQTSGPADR